VAGLNDLSERISRILVLKEIQMKMF
jgi:hypothetical protein